MLYGLLWGLWVVTASFGNFWIIKSFPAPGSWIAASVIAVLFFASLPAWFRMQRRFVYSTVWAKEHGYIAGKIKLFSFSRRNLWLVLLFAVVAILLAIGQEKLIMHLSGTSELIANLEENDARTQQRDAQRHFEPKRVRKLSGAPFMASLPDGGSIEVLAVRPNESTNRPWWQPNGLPSNFSADIQPASQAQHKEGVVAICREDFPQHHDNWPRANGVWGVDVTFKNGAEGFGPSNQPLANGALAIYFDDAPANGVETTLVVKVAAAEWQTLSITEPGFLNSLRCLAAGGGWSFSETLAGYLKVKNPHLKEDSNHEYRLTAVDEDGKEYLATETLLRPHETFAEIEASFQGLPLKGLRELRCETRPYYTVEFRHVSLQQGHQTTVEVKDFGGEGPVAPTVNGRDSGKSGSR